MRSEEEGSVTNCREVGKAITYQLKKILYFATRRKGSVIEISIYFVTSDLILRIFASNKT